MLGPMQASWSMSACSPCASSCNHRAWPLEETSAHAQLTSSPFSLLRPGGGCRTRSPGFDEKCPRGEEARSSASSSASCRAEQRSLPEPSCTSRSEISVCQFSGPTLNVWETHKKSRISHDLTKLKISVLVSKQNPGKRSLRILLYFSLTEKWPENVFGSDHSRLQLTWFRVPVLWYTD